MGSSCSYVRSLMSVWWGIARIVRLRIKDRYRKIAIAGTQKVLLFTSYDIQEQLETTRNGKIGRNRSKNRKKSRHLKVGMNGMCCYCYLHTSRRGIEGFANFLVVDDISRHNLHCRTYSWYSYRFAIHVIQKIIYFVSLAQPAAEPD